MKQPNGYILYSGPSLLDGAPIVAIGTGFAGASANPKTGDMIQVWILRQDIAPHHAIHTGDDASVCGNCPLRGAIVAGRNVKRECYVSTFQAPNSVWKKYKRNGYPMLDTYSRFSGRKVRLGAYGDPAAVPKQYLQAAVNASTGITGYTHQYASSPEYSTVAMASADNSKSRAAAKALGFRTFRVMRKNETLEAGEILCPASKEAGVKTNCVKCGLCNGNPSSSRKRPVPDIAIYIH
jgi:hypothetical protein|tara:strand:+ start:257 stop:967 length:711 start_codon:yes stop_codon:yes gene_type:complete